MTPLETCVTSMLKQLMRTATPAKKRDYAEAYRLIVRGPVGGPDGPAADHFDYLEESA